MGLVFSECRARIFKLRRLGHQESFDGATGSVRAPVLPRKGHLDEVDIAGSDRKSTQLLDAGQMRGVKKKVGVEATGLKLEEKRALGRMKSS